MSTILIYGDSMSWGIIPGSRNRLPFPKRWPGVLQNELGSDYRIVEECLNGRTTRYEDPNRPGRHGLNSIQMLLESHAPIDHIILMLGINDFQDAIGAGAEESAEGLRNLVDRILSSKPEPMTAPARVLVVIPPEIQSPRGMMAEKFSGYRRGQGSEAAYIRQLQALDIDLFLASEHIGLSRVDGIHLDEPEHQILGKALASTLRRQDRDIQ